MVIEHPEIIVDLNRKNDWVIKTIIHIIVIFLALYLGHALSYGEVWPVEHMKQAWLSFPVLIIAYLIFNRIVKTPKVSQGSIDRQPIQNLMLSGLLLTMTAMSLSFLFSFSVPRSFPVIFGVSFICISLVIEMIGALLSGALHNPYNERVPVVIYGAGEGGIQLVSVLKNSKKVEPVAFIDDNKLKQKSVIFGLAVHPPEDLEQLVKRKKIGRILVAIAKLSEADRKKMTKRLAHLPCEIRFMPPDIDIIHGKNILESFTPFKPEDLLDRDKFDVALPNISKPYTSKVVLISGAGGSIGLELCRQLLRHNPKKLVIFEQSELALYQAERELRSVAKKLGVIIVPILGSVCDAKTLAHVFMDQKIQVVFHAAAYKHVPLVESNETAGIHNNVLGTNIIAQQALASKIETFILISTDKAVRPTNIMGATKRLAELIVQDCDNKSKSTKFSMVRFGNVLGSSGSVIPLFKDQIAKGGPVTLTHEDVTRYLMAISEAAYLVIVAGSFAQGGEVFVLDMGTSVKIKDLARQMIEKSGFTVRSDNNPTGDIEIITTGLRPGEKLYEELLIDAETLPTPHPKVMRAKEKSLSSKDIQKLIKDIKLAVSKNDSARVRKIIIDSVDGYQTSP